MLFINSCTCEQNAIRHIKQNIVCQHHLQDQQNRVTNRGRNTRRRVTSPKTTTGQNLAQTQIEEKDYVACMQEKDKRQKSLGKDKNPRAIKRRESKKGKKQNVEDKPTWSTRHSEGLSKQCHTNKFGNNEGNNPNPPHTNSIERLNIACQHTNPKDKHCQPSNQLLNTKTTTPRK